jgi:hypothetical protein
MAQVQIYHIYYNQETRARLQPGFLPLDNTENKRPDWFEFWVIKNFLEQNQLHEDTWYGFLSPRFQDKTGVKSSYLLELLDAIDQHADVLLVDFGWDQLAYFKNPWEQGEAWHPGITELTQHFLDATGRDIRLDDIVTSTATAVFSNYVIAKKKYWQEWLDYAEDFFDFVETGPGKTSLSASTGYGSVHNPYPMKTFVQERFPSLILTRSPYRVYPLDSSDRAPALNRLFPGDNRTRRLLQSCNLMKSMYGMKRDASYLDMYLKLRENIRYTPPVG